MNKFLFGKDLAFRKGQELTHSEPIPTGFFRRYLEYRDFNCVFSLHGKHGILICPNLFPHTMSYYTELHKKQVAVFRELNRSAWDFPIVENETAKLKRTGKHDDFFRFASPIKPNDSPHLRLLVIVESLGL